MGTDTRNVGNVSDTHRASATGMARANWRRQKQKNQFVTGDNLFVTAATKKMSLWETLWLKEKQPLASWVHFAAYPKSTYR